MKTNLVLKSLLVVALLAGLAMSLGSSEAVAQGGNPNDVVSVNIGASSITWTSLVGGIQGMTLTVTGPDGFYFRHEFGSKATISSRGLADGSYYYEIVLSPGYSQSSGADPSQRGLDFSSGQTMSQSGGFVVLGGSFVRPMAEETTRVSNQISPKDQVIADDLIVQGSECVGFDCVNNESFGFDTIRLKENNLRIKFEDTSTAAGFPTNDWQITANDSASGGVSYLAFEDITGAKFPFKVIAGAPTNSLYVGTTGNVGVGTGAPVLDIHIATSDTPAIRFEQNSSGGFTAQTWDVAGNEANFFVRDVTGGSRLPLRIRPGAPTSSIDIAASGDVGIGTASPAYSLDVAKTGANPTLAVRRTDGATMKILSVTNHGRIGTENNFPLHFIVNDVSKMNLATNGNLTVTGSVTATAFNVSSDKNLKENFSTVDRTSVLDRLASLPISTWNFKDGDGKATHMGPMAQDFYRAFGLGVDDKHISTLDADGVAFAAIQELNSRNETLRSENAALRNQIQDLAERVSVLESSGTSPSGQPLNGMTSLVVLLVVMNLGLVAWLVWSSRRGLVLEFKSSNR